MTDPAAAPQDPGRVHDVANAQRRLLLGLLAGIVMNIAIRVSDGGALLLAVLVGLAVAVYTIIWVVRLCQALGKTPWLYAIAVFIPLVGLIALIILNQQATTYLKAHGVKVGFLGAKV
jgi:hypothetical protein